MIPLAISASLLHIGHSSTSISAQLFCDNFCTVWFNGEVVFDDTSRSRTVDEFTIPNIPESGTRTFAVMLKDNPYDINEGIWNYENPTFLAGQTDASGNPIVRQFCLGDGGFRAVFTDRECEEEIVVSSSDWKCETVLTGPRDITACFPNWDEDHTPVTMGGVNDSLTLYDPCIRSSDPSFGPNYEDCDCKQDFNEDYINWATSWYEPGFDDSAWVAATEYTEEDAVPKLGRSATQTFEECTTGDYCDRETYPVESWADSEFIWSAAIELDNVVVCRYEYVSVCDEEGEQEEEGDVEEAEETEEGEFETIRHGEMHLESDLDINDEHDVQDKNVKVVMDPAMRDNLWAMILVFGCFAILMICICINVNRKSKY